jgi:hypothetical protein
MQSWSMTAASPKDRVLGNIIAIVSISVLTGFFFMQGVVNAVRGERLLTWLFFLCLPFLAFAIVVLARRILREIR